MNPIRILLADDHQIVLEGLVSLLDGEADIQVVATALDGGEVMKLLAHHPVDVLVLDYSMPIMDGATTLQKVREQFPQIRTIMLSFSDDGKVIHEVISAGAVGYILKNKSSKNLVEAIRTVARGEKYLPHHISQILMEYLQRPQPAADPHMTTKISDREEEVIACIMDGMAAKQIAEVLFISEPTVNTHKKNLFDRFGFSSATQLGMLGQKRGIKRWTERKTGDNY